MRDRLIELLKNISSCRNDDCSKCGCGDICFSHREADYLLENGVIVPPTKFGDTIYVIPSKTNRDLNIINGFSHLNRVYEQKISKIEIYANNKYLLTTCDGLQSVHCDLYQETWFLTKEEAEQALKGGVQE